MALRREDASDDELRSNSDDADIFSDSDHEVDALTEITANLQIGERSSSPQEGRATTRLDQEGSSGGETDLEEVFRNAAAEPANSEEDVENESSPSLQESEGRVYSGGNGSLGSLGSDMSAGSEVDLSTINNTAAKPEADGQEQATVPLPNKSEQDQRGVPAGKFWLHDDRTTEDANNRRAGHSRKIWDPFDDKKWVHDKFDLPEDQDDYQGFIGRGRQGSGRRQSENNGLRDQDASLAHHSTRGGAGRQEYGGQQSTNKIVNARDKGAKNRGSRGSAQMTSRNGSTPPPGFENVQPLPKHQPGSTGWQEQWPALPDRGNAAPGSQPAEADARMPSAVNGMWQEAMDTSTDPNIWRDPTFSTATQNFTAQGYQQQAGNGSRLEDSISHANAGDGIQPPGPAESTWGQSALPGDGLGHLQQSYPHQSHAQVRSAPLNYEAQEWTGASYRQPPISRLDADAQEFIPPGYEKFVPQGRHLASGRTSYASGHQSSASYQLYQSQDVHGRPSTTGRSGANFNVYQPMAAQGQEFDPQASQTVTEGTFMPGPMQTPASQNASTEVYHKQARRPVTIAAPHDQQYPLPSPQQPTGRSRRYSTMKTQLQ